MLNFKFFKKGMLLGFNSNRDLYRFINVFGFSICYSRWIVVLCIIVWIGFLNVLNILEVCSVCKWLVLKVNKKIRIKLDWKRRIYFNERN